MGDWGSIPRQRVVFYIYFFELIGRAPRKYKNPQDTTAGRQKIVSLDRRVKKWVPGILLAQGTAAAEISNLVLGRGQ